MEKAFVAQRVARKLFATEHALDAAMTEAAELMADLLKARPAANVMVEIPSFMATDPANLAAIRAVHANGNALLLKGRPANELPREVLPCFSYSIIDLADDRRGKFGVAPAGVKRSIPFVQSGIHSIADMEESFVRGAAAVLGWRPVTSLETLIGMMVDRDLERLGPAR